MRSRASQVLVSYNGANPAKTESQIRLNRNRSSHSLHLLPSPCPPRVPLSPHPPNSGPCTPFTSSSVSLTPTHTLSEKCSWAAHPRWRTCSANPLGDRPPSPLRMWTLCHQRYNAILFCTLRFHLPHTSSHFRHTSPSPSVSFCTWSLGRAERSGAGRSGTGHGGIG